MSDSAWRWLLGALICVVIAAFAGLGEKPQWSTLAISAIGAILNTMVAVAIIIADAIKSKG